MVHDEHYSSYTLSGIVIDSFVYKTIGNWRWLSGSSSSPRGTYERKLLDDFNSLSVFGCCNFELFAPGSGQRVDVSKSIECLGKVLRYMS